MEATGIKLLNREEITDATLAAFADSTVIPNRYDRSDEVQDSVVVGDDESYELPVIDMASMLHPELSEEEIAKLGSACREWGFFQLTNHGVDETVIKHMKDNILQFFSLPLEKMMRIAVPKNSTNGEGFGHHFSKLSDNKLDWAQSLLLNTQQVEDRNMELWPTEPSTFRDALDKYSVEIANLANRLLVSMAINLGIKEETLLEPFQGKQQSIVVNYYPQCRHPDKVIGIPPHSDKLDLTLLLHVDYTPGLQLKKDGKWFPVKPHPGAFVINIGDILEVLTNGRYRSIEHRAVPNASRDRITIMMFQDACVEGMVKPLLELGEPRYKSIEKDEYLKGNFEALVDGSRFVESLKV